MDKSQLLESIRSRTGHAGVLTADRYFRSIEGCFEGGFCPTKLFQSASGDQWAKALKEAESRLTYAGPLKINHKTLKTGSEVGPGLLMSFDCVVTTPRRDRDKDILDTKGANLDPAAPLLWQHIPIQPLGPQLSQRKSAKALHAGFGIADTELGQDAATLVECKALRISHGFYPDDDEDSYEALEDMGWHFHKFTIYEASLVSVPSNEDAIIESFSRNKLHNEGVRAWAKKKFDGRKAMAPGVTLPDLKTITADWLNAVKDAAINAGEVPPCACQHKEATPEETKDAMPVPSVECQCPDCGRKGPLSDFQNSDEGMENDVEMGMASFDDSANTILKLAPLTETEKLKNLYRRLHGVLSAEAVQSEEEKWRETESLWTE